MSDLSKANASFPQKRLGVTVKLKGGKKALVLLMYLPALP